MAEDAAADVKGRLAGLCRHRGLALAALPLFVITAPSVRLDLPRDQQRRADTVRRQAPRLLLLDPFVRLHRINENQASEVAAVLGHLRDLQRTYDLAVVVVHHARKHGGSPDGHSLRGSGDFFAWVDSALFVRRHRRQVVLSVEHRAAGAPEPVTLALVGTERDLHLAIVAGEPQGAAATPSAPADLDTALLAALDHAAPEGLARAALRAGLRVRNERLGDALTRLAAAGQIARHGDAWVRRAVPADIATAAATPRNGNGNGDVSG